MHDFGKEEKKEKGLKLSSTKQLYKAKIERQMGRIILCNIVNTARVLEFPTIEKNENVEIETQDSKQSFILGNDDDKRVNNTANDMSDGN